MFPQRFGVRRVEQVDRVHQLEVRSFTAVFRELVFVESGECRAESFLERVRDRAARGCQMAGEDFL